LKTECNTSSFHTPTPPEKYRHANFFMIHSQFHYGDAEHAQYETQGFCILDHFLTDAALTSCREHVDRMVDGVPGTAVEVMIGTHQRDQRWLWELAGEEKLLDMLERQIGPNIVLWSTHLLCKSPRTGSLVPWHQDAPFWNVSGKLSGGVWIPLDDVDEGNGTMSVLPGWHTRGALPTNARPGEIFDHEIDPEIVPDDVDERKVVYCLKAGQMATHHTMIPHSSVPNTSDRWRRLIVLRYMAADGQFGARGYTDYRTGETFPRRFFLMRGKDVNGFGLEHSPFE